MENNQLQITTSNSLISEKELEFAKKVNEILQHTSQIAIQENPFTRGLMMANAMQQIEAALTPEIMAPVNKLFGSPIGIRCDKKDYSDDVKKRIFVEATLGGWGIVGNQINVIGGNLYVTKQGYLPRLRAMDGLSFTYPFKHRIPAKDPNTLTTSVSTEMEYVWQGKPYKEVLTYPVIRNDGQSNDAILGKADTKMCRWLWNKITGQETIDDGGYSQIEVVESTPNKPEVKKEEITGLISPEFQEKFNSYISKATSKEDLLKKASTWINAPQAKGAGASCFEEDGMLKSATVDMSVFNELFVKLS